MGLEKFSNAFDVPQCQHNLGANLAGRGGRVLLFRVVALNCGGEDKRGGWRGVGDGVAFFFFLRPEQQRGVTVRCLGLDLGWILSESFRTLREWCRRFRG